MSDIKAGRSPELVQSSSPEVHSAVSAHSMSPAQYSASMSPAQYTASPATTHATGAFSSEYQQSSYPEVVPERDDLPEVVPGQGKIPDTANQKFLPATKDGFSPTGTGYSSASPAFSKAPIQPAGSDEKQVVGGSGGRGTGTICGLPRRRFWIFLGIGLFVAIAAIVAGTVAGVMAGKNSNGSGNAEAAATEAPEVTTIPGTPQTSSTASSTSSAPTPEASTVQSKDNGPIQVDCPQASGFNYTTKGKTFSRECGVNYANGDLRLVNGQVVRSAKECMDLCAAADKCVGMVWNRVPQCYLKSGIQQKSNVPGTEAAVLFQ